MTTENQNFTAADLRAIQGVLQDRTWNWGSFASRLGDLLAVADAENARKLALAFPNEFAGWLEMSKRPR